MALLPAGPAGQAYAPAALRHLMTDPDSPVADLYQSCNVCEGLRKAESIATLALMEVSNYRIHYEPMNARRQDLMDCR